MTFIIKHEPRADATHRLFCFPFGGGSAATYRPWNAHLPAYIECCAVELPGRLPTRTSPLSDTLQVVDAIYPEMLEEFDRPFILFAHSFGSIIAYELSRRLQRDGKTMPQHLMVSSRRAPQVERLLTPTYELPDDEFIEAMQTQYDAIPEAVLNEPDLMSLLLPILRADITLNETYLASVEPKLSIPVTVYYGDQDKTSHVETLEQWREVTTGPFELKSFPSGHFFIDTFREAVVSDIVSKFSD